MIDQTERPRSPLASTVRLARGWYGSAERRMAWGLTVLVVLMTLAQIATALGVNAWNGAFFAALDRRDQAAMTHQAWLFAGLALLTMALAVAQLGARQMLALSWRRWLVQHLQGRWARDASNYRMGLLPDAADNPDQRISENTRWATAVSVDLGCSLLYAVINLVSFVGLLLDPLGRGAAGRARGAGRHARPRRPLCRGRHAADLGDRPAADRDPCRPQPGGSRSTASR
ncbi:SbmA/BacA-like family transporter [Dankookia sp. P2]|uniref:SbmA/BacA-like family transporter n=1 Tax=Dankookia sp. P2 TaxID=3423955 RepID=UPI003D677B31